MPCPVSVSMRRPVPVPVWMAAAGECGPLGLLWEMRPSRGVGPGVGWLPEVAWL